MSTEQIKIGPITYRIEEIAGLYDDDNDRDLFGWFRSDLGAIQLEANLAPAMRRAVLWHEIIHAIFEQSGHKQREPLCDALGYAITQILADNPWLAQPPEA